MSCTKIKLRFCLNKEAAWRRTSVTVEVGVWASPVLPGCFSSRLWRITSWSPTTRWAKRDLTWTTSWEKTSGLQLRLCFRAPVTPPPSFHLSVSSLQAAAGHPPTPAAPRLPAVGTAAARLRPGSSVGSNASPHHTLAPLWPPWMAPAPPIPFTVPVPSPPAVARGDIRA